MYVRIIFSHSSRLMEVCHCGDFGNQHDPQQLYHESYYCSINKHTPKTFFRSLLDTLDIFIDFKSWHDSMYNLHTGFQSHAHTSENAIIRTLPNIWLMFSRNVVETQNPRCLCVSEGDQTLEVDLTFFVCKSHYIACQPGFWSRINNIAQSGRML